MPVKEPVREMTTEINWQLGEINLYQGDGKINVRRRKETGTSGTADVNYQQLLKWTH